MTRLARRDNLATYRYDDLGRLETSTSYDDEDAVVNQVEFTYDGWGNVSVSEQEHDGAVDDGNTLAVEYTFTDGGEAPEDATAEYVRLQKIAYPGASREVYYNYGSTGGADDRLSRVANIAADDNGTTQYAAYTYLGGGTIVKVAHPAVTGGLNLTYGTGGTYGGFDRFGRIVDQKWQDDAGTPAVKDQFAYAYDRASNRVSRDVGPDMSTPPTGFDEAYLYDGLNRLIKMNRGDLAGGTITDANADFSQAWAAWDTDHWNTSLDAVGNWTEFKEDSDGGGSGDTGWSLDQNRVHNEVNEIDGNGGDPIWPQGGSGGWIDPDYDAAGNQASGPEPGNETAASQAHFYVYDAWNRLVDIWKDTNGNGIHEPAHDWRYSVYRYDGLGRRVRKTLMGIVTVDYYYSGWQVVEERRDGDTDPWWQYVWGLRYVHSPVCRWCDEDTDGANVEMHYYANDANFNVTALVEPDGDVAVRYAYDPYGRVTLLAPDFGDPGGMDLPPNTLYFTGHRLEAETGLYLTPYRPYHYGLGRWLQRDPIGYGDGMGLYEYASARPLQVVDPSGHCSCTQEEVKEKFLAKLKVNVMPGSLDVAIGAAQECDTPADIGRPCTATVTYAVSRPMNWDPQNPGDPTSPRMSLMAKCRSRMRLVCACGEWRVPGLDWVVWSNYYWEYGPGANPEALSANVCIFREWWEIDETRVRLRRLYNDILRWISPGWEDWPSWMIDPYNAVGRLLGIGVIKSTEPDDFLTGRGEYRYNEIFRGDYGPGKAAQQMCVDGVEGG